MAQSATFGERSAQEALVLPEVVGFLERRPGTVHVVPATAEQQRQDDVDLVWTRSIDGTHVERTVEVKVDSQVASTGNFAYETISNELRATPGCFIRTKSYWFLYVCATTMTVWAVETERVQRWFAAEMAKRKSRFRQFQTYTEVNGQYYATLGRLVPVRDFEHGLRNQFVRECLLPRSSND